MTVAPVPSSQQPAMADDVRDFISSQDGPYGAKLTLAWTIACQYHGPIEADRATRSWMAQVSGKLPADIPEVTLSRTKLDDSGRIPLDRLVVDLGMATSLTQARSLIKQGAVSIYREA